MPTYEYACTSCGGHFDYFHGISEEPKKFCETCGGPLQRLLSGGSGLIFKGSGFYITDYKGESSKGSDSKPAASSDAKAGGDPKSGGDSKSGGETKSAGAERPATESKPTPKAPKSET